MGETTGLENTVRQNRRALGWSQETLGERTGVSRHAIMAIEAGRRVPSTTLALRLARAFGCTVHELFRLTPAPELKVRLSSAGGRRASSRLPSPRVAVGRVYGRWVAHRLSARAASAADAILMEATAGPGVARARPVRSLRRLEGNVLVAGCAPLLANLVHRVGEGSGDARATWIPASSHRALDLLAAGLVHVAGLHLSGGHARQANVDAVRQRFPGRRMVIVNLTRWCQGFVVAPRNPLGIRSAADLLRPSVRVVRREAGAGASELVARLLTEDRGPRPAFFGPVAGGHLEVAHRVHCGAADTGVAIESAALAWGLGFVPLSEERFDLVIPYESAGAPPVSRFLETLDDPGFRAEAACLPGYDIRISGQARTLEAGGREG